MTFREEEEEGGGGGGGGELFSVLVKCLIKFFVFCFSFFKTGGEVV